MLRSIQMICYEYVFKLFLFFSFRLIGMTKQWTLYKWKSTLYTHSRIPFSSGFVVRQRQEVIWTVVGSLQINSQQKMDDESLCSSGGGSSGGPAGINTTLTQDASPDQLVLIRIYVPELNVEKCLQFHKDELIWEVKQQCLTALPKVSFLYLAYL